MTKIDWKAELEALDASLPERLERVVLMAEISNYYIDDMRVMPAVGVADILYEALDEIKRHRGIDQ
jgi:UDP-galactopyranose mutase